MHNVKKNTLEKNIFFADKVCGTPSCSTGILGEQPEKMENMENSGKQKATALQYQPQKSYFWFKKPRPSL